MIDALEAEKKTDVANNGKFGIDGLYELSKLTATSPKWNQPKGGPAPTTQERTEIIAAAKEALQHSQTLAGMAGADQRLDAAEMQKWEDQPQEIKFKQHINQLDHLGALTLLDQLDSAPKASSKTDSVISQKSIEQLAKLKPDSSAWNTLAEDIRPTPAQRADIIHAAQQVLKPENAKFLGALLGPDKTIRDVSLSVAAHKSRQNDANGLIDPFQQGRVGNCFIVGSIIAVNNTPEGKQAIADSIKHNSDGTHTVTFKGDPANPITVTDADLEKVRHSRGDKDTALFEVALEKYALDGKLAGTADPASTSKGGQPGPVMSMLTGKEFTFSQYENADTLIETLAQPNINVVFLTNQLFEPGGKIDHAFAVVSADPAARTVTLINPWRSDETITMKADDLAKLQHQVVKPA